MEQFKIEADKPITADNFAEYFACAKKAAENIDRNQENHRTILTPVLTMQIAASGHDKNDYNKTWNATSTEIDEELQFKLIQKAFKANVFHGLVSNVRIVPGVHFDEKSGDKTISYGGYNSLRSGKQIAPKEAEEYIECPDKIFTDWSQSGMPCKFRLPYGIGKNNFIGNLTQNTQQLMDKRAEQTAGIKGIFAELDRKQ